MSDDQIDSVRQKMKASIQFFHLFQLLGSKIFPDFELYEALSKDLESELLSAMDKHLSCDALIQKIVEQKINIELILNNPTEENLEKILSLLALPDAISGKKQFFTQSEPSSDSEYKYRLPLRDEDAFGYFIRGTNSSIFSQYFFYTESGQEKLERLHHKAIQHIEHLRFRFNTFEQLLAASQDKFIISEQEKYFLNQQFPLVFVVEKNYLSQKYIKPLHRTDNEFRSARPLTVGKDIQTIGTETHEQRWMVLRFLHAHNINNVRVVLIADLAKTLETQIPLSFTKQHEDGFPKLSAIAQQVVSAHQLENTGVYNPHFESARGVLERLKLNQYFDVIKNSYPLAQLIEHFILKGHQHLMVDLLENQSDALLKALLFAKDHKLNHLFEMLIANEGLAAEINLALEGDNHKALIRVLKIENISSADILAFCQDAYKHSAIDILVNKDEYNIYLSKNIINILQDKACATAIINFENSMDTYRLFSVVSSKERSKAANILFDANLATEDNISKLSISYNIPEIIILMHQHGLDNCLSLAFRDDINLYDFEALLKSDYAGQISEQMLMDESMRQILQNSRYSAEAEIHCFISLYKKDLLSDPIYTCLKENDQLLKQVIKLTENGYAECLDKESLHAELRSPEELMMDLLNKDHTVFSCLNETSAQNANFMLAAAAKDIRTLEHADFHLKTNASFITKAARVNHNALQYADTNLKNDAEFKRALKRDVLHYDYASKNDSRFHLFSANLNHSNSNLKADYKNKTGDALKTAILKQFKQSLEGINSSEIDSTVADFKNSSEYCILRTAQGITSSIFRLKTSSVKALEEIIDDAKSNASDVSKKF